MSVSLSFPLPQTHEKNHRQTDKQRGAVIQACLQVSHTGRMLFSHTNTHQIRKPGACCCGKMWKRVLAPLNGNSSVCLLFWAVWGFYCPLVASIQNNRGKLEKIKMPFLTDFFSFVPFLGSDISTDQKDHAEDPSHLLPHGHRHRVSHGHRYGGEEAWLKSLSLSLIPFFIILKSTHYSFFFIW